MIQDSVREKPDQKLVNKLKPHTKQNYAWDFPSANDKKIYLYSGDRARRVDIMEIGVLPPLKVELLLQLYRNLTELLSRSNP